MRTLTVEEAGAGLDRWVDLALAGEQICIRKGSALVELRPASPPSGPDQARLAPRDALRCLQEEARLSPQEAEAYWRSVREERRAAEERQPA